MLYLSGDDEHKKLRTLVANLYLTAFIDVAKLKDTNFDEIQNNIDRLTSQLISESRIQFEIERKKSKSTWKF